MSCHQNHHYLHHRRQREGQRFSEIVPQFEESGITEQKRWDQTINLIDIEMVMRMVMVVVVMMTMVLVMVVVMAMTVMMVVMVVIP